jgi:hypothetical protein
MIVDIIKADDWEGMYVDGTLCTESHHIDSEDILECVKNKVETLEDGITAFEYVISYVNQEWMEEQGSLPLNISDISEDVICK